MTHSDVLEMELVAIESWDMLYAMNTHPSPDEIAVYLERQARKNEIVHLLAKRQYVSPPNRERLSHGLPRSGDLSPLFARRATGMEHS